MLDNNQRGTGVTQGIPEGTYTDEGKRRGRGREGTNEAAGRQTQLEELKNINTRGARQLERGLDLHARGTGDERGVSAGAHRPLAAGCGGGGAAGEVPTGCSACGGTPLRSRRPSGPKTPISNMIYDILHITLHFLRHSGLGECETKANACYVLYYFGRAWSGLHLHCGVWLLFSC
jgi:hypothetical protein